MRRQQEPVPPEDDAPAVDAEQATATAEATAAPAVQRAHVRGSALLMLGRVIALLLGVATQVLIVRALSKADYGVFAYALALAGGGEILLSLGQGKLLSRFLATYEEQRDYPRMFGSILLAVGTIFTTSLLLIGALYLFSDALIGSAVGDPSAVRLVLILVFLAPLQSLDQVFVSLFAVFSKPRAIFFRKFLLAPCLRLVVVVILFFSHATVAFLAVGYLAAAVVGLGLYLTLLVNAMRERGLLQEFKPRQLVVPYREVFSFSMPLITGELALLAMNMGGVVILALYHSSVEVANYRAVFSSARLNTAVATSFATLFLPVIARLYARADVAGLRHSYWHTASFVAVFTFPVFALTGPLAPATTVTLFTDRYAASATVLSILATGYYVNASLGFNVYTLQVCGRIRHLVGVNILAATVNLGLCFLLAPAYGAVGVAAANCTAMVSQNLVNQWVLRGSISTRFIDRESRACYAMIVLGAAALWGFEALASPGILMSVAAAAVVSLAVIAVGQKALRLGETFPELLRIPVLGKLVR